MSTVKSYFSDIKAHIIEEIKKANFSIIIAVAWFTDAEIFNSLNKKASNGIKVEMLIVDDDINANSKINYEVLFENGGKVWKIERDQSTMHNKFCVIDHNIVINGSYNWTNKANENHENIMIVSGDENLAINYLEEFNTIKKRYLGTTTEAFLKLSKRLSALNILISLGDREDVLRQGEKIKALSLFVNRQQYLDLKKAIKLCESYEYNDATEIIETLIKQTSDYKENSLNDYDTVGDYSEGFAIVSKNGKYGYIDKLGKESIPVQFDSALNFKKGVAMVNLDGVTSLIDKTGNLMFDRIEKLDKVDSCFIAHRDYSVGLITKYGDLIRNVIYDDIIISEFNNQYARIDFDDNVNLINREGEFYFSDDFYITDEFFFKRWFVIRVFNKSNRPWLSYQKINLVSAIDNESFSGRDESFSAYCIMTERGLFTDIPQSDEMTKFSEISYLSPTLIKVLGRSNKKWNMIDLTNEEYILPDWVDEISSYTIKNTLKLILNKKWQIYSLENREYLLPEWLDGEIISLERNNTLLKIHQSGKWQFCDLIRKQFISPMWVDDIRSIDNSYNLFIVKNGNKWNIVGNGRFIFEEWGNEIIEDRSICVGNKWHFIKSLC